VAASKGAEKRRRKSDEITLELKESDTDTFNCGRDRTDDYLSICYSGQVEAQL
jgi:hypothetical protein